MSEIEEYEYSDYMDANDTFQVLDNGKYQMIVDNPRDMEHLWR